MYLRSILCLLQIVKKRKMLYLYKAGTTNTKRIFAHKEAIFFNLIETLIKQLT
ncbi:hypothetical protein MuYL_4838 [Mucilaginibacter xinganensis]|uniref:Uncharacterized protein n=1 Tax=Mucilaginibacter xinganensis TaxID=1234841 RepID=A0A223P4K4_9SPHI|nr:hypothetical protein MuYL_4838 [Mucilaginibacter xinganensis]